MPELSPELRQFLLQHFDSVESLEIVALLERSSTAYWTGSALSQRLGIPEKVVTAKLDALTASNLLMRGEQTGAYRFAPRSEDVREHVQQLLKVYSDQRSAIINLVYSANLEKLRSFSEAFRLKKES